MSSYRYINRVLIALLALLTFQPCTTSAQDEMVGLLGDFNTMKIVGAKIVGEQTIREALQQDWPTQLASTPSAPLDVFLRTLKDQMAAGYLKYGFPNAKIDVSANVKAKMLTLTIEEGKQFFQGNVILHGADALAGEMVTYFTKVWSTTYSFPHHIGPDGTTAVGGWKQEKQKGDAYWEKDEPMSFEARNDERIIRHLRRFFFLEGYQQAKFEHELHRVANQVDLVVTVKDLGAKTSIGEIEVKGAKRHTPEEIIKYLGLKVNQPFDLKQQFDVHRKLFESGRFREHVVYVQPPSRAALAKDGPKAKIIIKVVESTIIPKLTETLSDNEILLLKTRKWALEPKKWTKDLVIKADGKEKGEIKIVFRATKGLFIKVAFLEKIPNMEWLPNFSALATNKRLGLFLADSNRRFVYETSEKVINVTMEMGPNSDKDIQRPNTLSFGAAVTSEKSEDDNPLHLGFQIAPVTLLEGARGNDVKMALKDEVLIVTTKGTKTRINAKTGELIDVFVGPPKDQAQDQNTLGAAITARFVKDGFAEAVEENDKDYPGPNLVDTQHPYLTVFNILLPELLKIEPIAKNIKPINLAIYQEFIRQMFITVKNSEAEKERTGLDSDDRFQIPFNSNITRNEDLFGPMFAMEFPLIDNAFERGSWPWTIARERLNAIGQSSPYTINELRRMGGSQTMGPVGYLTTAHAFASVNVGLAHAFARRGLQTLTPKYFQNDCDALLSGTGRVSSAMRDMLRRLQTTDASQLPKDSLLRKTIKALNHEPGKHFDKSDIAQTELFRVLKDEIEKELKRLSTLKVQG